jgi:hypothetical protein
MNKLFLFLDKYEVESILLIAERVEAGFINRFVKDKLPVDIDVEYKDNYPSAVALIKNSKTGPSIIAAVKNYVPAIWDAMPKKAKFLVINSHFWSSIQCMREAIRNFNEIGIPVSKLQKSFDEMDISELHTIELLNFQYG